MVNLLPVLINSTGVIIGIFALWVVISIYYQYELDRLLFFVAAAVFIVLWNIMHLVLNIISPQSYLIARLYWTIAILSGYGLVLFSLIGFNQLREEYLKWRIVIYTALLSAFITIFFTDPSTLTVKYSPENGWTTITPNPLPWLAFSFLIMILVGYELIIPQFRSLLHSSDSNAKLNLVSLVGVFIAIFSNLLIPVIESLHWPADLRFLIADTGFLIWFLILKEYPFTGIYDPTKIFQITIAGTQGDIIKTYATSYQKAMLTSGAIIGINTVLENIHLTQEDANDDMKDYSRKIQLGETNYFIYFDDLITIFHYSQGRGVCMQKFKILAKMVKKESIIDNFDKLISQYFPGNPLKLKEVNIQAT